MKKTIGRRSGAALVFGLLSVLALGRSQAYADGNCPKALVFTDANFLHGEEFPTDAQILNNFKQTFRVPGEEKDPIATFFPSDVTETNAFMNVLKAEYKNRSLSLPLAWNAKDQTCEGTLGSGPASGKTSYKYTYNDDEGLLIMLDPSERVAIGANPPTQGDALASHVALNVSLAIPSNCSNCPNTAELFEFQQESLLPDTDASPTDSFALMGGQVTKVTCKLGTGADAPTVELTKLRNIDTSPHDVTKENSPVAEYSATVTDPASAISETFSVTAYDWVLPGEQGEAVQYLASPGAPTHSAGAAFNLAQTWDFSVGQGDLSLGVTAANHKNISLNGLPNGSISCKVLER